MKTYNKDKKWEWSRYPRASPWHLASLRSAVQARWIINPTSSGLNHGFVATVRIE